MNTTAQLPNVRTSANDSVLFFTTEQQYRHTATNFKYSDGVKALADQFECNWFLDLCFFNAKHEKALQKEEYITWKLERQFKNNKPTDKFVATATDDEGNIKFQQKVPFSDINTDSVKLFFWEGMLLLPSEC